METLNKIIKGCFEALFGTMIGGLVIFTLQSMRKKWRILLVVWVLLAGMAVWRFFIPNFYSPRYAAAFIFPATVFTAFMMVKFRKWWWVLLAVFCIICCCKVSRVSTTGALFSKSASVIAADAKGRGKAMFFSERYELRRIGFYSGLPGKAISIVDWDKFLLYLDYEFRINSRNFDVLYLCWDVPEGKVISIADLKGIKSGKLDLIASFPKSRKKRINFHIYRYQKSDLKQINKI